MWYLKSAFETYQKLQDTVQDQLSEVQSAILSPVDMMKRFLGAGQRSGLRQESGPEVEALRKRVAELEARLKKSAAQTKRRRKRP